jgi:DNA-directed RNA polymerase specialized sigma24 family protein
LKIASHTDINYLDALKNDDNEAFERLYRKYWKRLYDFVFVKTRDGNVSEEIIQDLFVTLWEKRNTLKINHLEN